MIFVIISPPLPITSLILAGSIVNVRVLGAYLLTSLLGSLICLVIVLSISILAFLACAKASSNISLVIPFILISICNAQIPSLVPATLKSISPK